jgi:hypothetical protein
MRKKLLIGVLITTAILMLLSYFIASTGNFSVTTNGEQMHGIQALGIASDGVLIALLGIVLAIIVVAVVALGASIMLSVALIFALCFCLLVFFPVFLPVVVVAVIAAWLVRKIPPT